jgi:PAS domain S-box-containing protein
MPRLTLATITPVAVTAAFVALAAALADLVSDSVQSLAQHRLIGAGPLVLTVVAFGIAIVCRVSERRRILKQIRDSDEYFRQLAKNIREVFWMSDPQKNEIFYVSPAYEEIWGRTIESLKRDPKSFLDAVHPDDRERVKAAVDRQAKGVYDQEYRIVRPDGSVRWIRDRSFPIADDHGADYRIAGLAEDITANNERENRLRQAQKLASIGRLAGGVAHDFNNFLGIILGNAELLKEQIGDEQEAAESVRSIEQAARRAVDLTDRMLTFARQKNPTITRLDVNASLAQIERFLKPILGEDVTVTLNLTDRRTPVLTDGSYLESSIINLAANARDAMPEGGRLTIETSVLELTERDSEQYANLKPGRYVQIAVSDTGTGISAEHLQHVFDPFYTTKEVGQGTGLGLSMVYGFAKESKGQVTIFSEDGIGTTVRLYLPYDGGQEPGQAEASRLGLLSGGTEAILVVEDDGLIRSCVCKQLSNRGYRVIEAQNAAEALEIVESSTPIDLIFTDVVMPGGMDGPTLAERVRAHRPAINVLFTTGYADHAAVARLSATNANVINKPYRPDALAFAIREAIDSGSEEGTDG